MRPAAKLAIAFGVLALLTFISGMSGVFDTAPGVWGEAWQIAVLVHAGLVVVFGYYISKTGGIWS